MNRIFITSTPQPASAELIAEAHALGAGQIIHRPLPQEYEELADGYHEIPDPNDVPV